MFASDSKKLFAVAILGMLTLACSAQTNFLTIFTNGPASNRFNIVFLSEGYTSSQFGKFLADVTNGANAMLSHQPYQEYRSYFNVYAIAVASVQSGSSHPAWPSTNNTFFKSYYDPVNDYYISIPPAGQARVDSLLTNYMPRYNLSILLVNDQTDGGSDGFDRTAISSIGYQMPELLTHETGHVVANLGDEYADAYPGFPDTEEPNTTTNLTNIKWKAWIAADTPVPTVPIDNYPSAIGAFEGAHYHSTGWYRPKLNCLMRSFNVAFCEGCSETMTLAFYRKARPIESFSPATTNLGLSSAQPLTFSLSLLQPATHSLNVQWFSNGTPVSDATNTSFTLFPQTLSPGTNIVKAVVFDPTALVRNDPSNLLTQTLTWTLSQLRLDSTMLLPGGKFAFRVTGNVSQPVVVQASTNLATWVPQRTNSLVNGSFWYTNSGVNGSAQLYFRAKSPP